MPDSQYDAILIVAFGGPERREDVIPFLENVTRGRGVPRERLLEVAEHYYHFDGASPLNAQVRELTDALRIELDRYAVHLPLYWGNRNWHPLLADTMRQMTENGVRRALALVLAAYSSYSSCRRYREDIERARLAAGSGAPTVDKVRVFYNHPGFVAANVERVDAALKEFPAERRSGVHVAYTAHSIPATMAASCDYEKQLRETCRLVSEDLGIDAERWELVYQSRSGRPEDPWLEPDICDHLHALQGKGVRDVLVMPIGFLSDHLEVLYDLDVEARRVAEKLGLSMARVATAGTHPLFVGALRELILERVSERAKRRSVGRCGPAPDVCPADCCPAPPRPARAS